MPIVSPGPRLILKLAATARAYGEGIGRFFGQVDNSRGSKRGLTRPRQKLRQRHTITPSRSLPSKLIEISPGGTSREQDRTDFGKRFSLLPNQILSPVSDPQLPSRTATIAALLIAHFFI